MERGKKSRTLLILFSIFLSLTSIAETRRNIKSSTDGELLFYADSIDYRKDLTRVYGRISGRPHTSNRIDYIGLRQINTIQIPMTDLDGVDPKRWFQYEDNGEINLEIDFPPMKIPDNMIIDVKGPHGTSTWTLDILNTPKHSTDR